MKFLFSEKCLILIFCLLFFSSSLFLFGRNVRELNPDQGKSWWTLSFATPQDQTSLAFTIENHSDTTEFLYQITADKKTLFEENISVERGQQTVVRPTLVPQQNLRTSIIVTAKNEKKEIYR